MYPELDEIVCMGYTKDSSYGDEGESIKGGHIVARLLFWRNARLCIPNNQVLK
jgi:hypothetical protein